ncbi:MAG TPA: cysteine desulfurase family protein [Balneolaceae bacterium]|nr:cysteine desulfurase family protein [Balneolaceae bacterium]
MHTIYFDHAATTPVDERVFEAMKPYFLEEYGNANSTHQMGNKARVAVEEARESIAEILGAEPAEIIFTSGGTESDNTAIKGVLQATGKKEIITSPLEHHAVLHSVEAAKRNGVKPIYLKPEKNGMISPQKVADAITEETAMVSLMHVNNEIGVINPIEEISGVCRAHDVPFHSDMVQSTGKLPIDVKKMGVDFISVSGHKIYGPKGIGVLYIRHATPWMPWMHGGSQERRRRGGTLNVPGIVGMGKALELMEANRDEYLQHCRNLRKTLVDGLHERFPDIISMNGNDENCVPYIINISLTGKNNQGVDGEMLLLNLEMEDICVSNGSACSSGTVEASHVLSGIGLDDHIANSSIRISLGKDNTEEEIEFFLDKLEEVVNRMKVAV